ncbi:MAG: hypothetical protein IJI97_08350 [Clostridia bacterium]|nr:hypothetical protein [Clostridia bacterium]
MSEKIYRVCRRCGKDWNVSRLDPGPKAYVCPICEVRERLRARQPGGEEVQNNQRKAVDLRAPAGGTPDQRTAVYSASAAAGGSAQRPGGEE